MKEVSTVFTVPAYEGREGKRFQHHSFKGVEDICRMIPSAHIYALIFGKSTSGDDGETWVGD
jgi:hypothetical protein